MNTRKNEFQCPACGYNLQARENDKIICLRVTCNWSIPYKRKTDIEMQTVNDLRAKEGEI